MRPFSLHSRSAFSRAEPKKMIKIYDVFVKYVVARYAAISLERAKPAKSIKVCDAFVKTRRSLHCFASSFPVFYVPRNEFRLHEWSL